MKQRGLSLWCGVALCAATGCGGAEEGRATSVGAPTTITMGASPTTIGTGGTDDGPPTSGPTASSGGDGSPTADETGDDGPKFDLGNAPDVTPEVPEECTKVDILFAIDNSGSMAGEQANLIAAFPGFVSGIQGALQFADSYHIGVVTSDSYGPNPDECDGVGDLVTRTGGDNSSDQDCGPYASGFRWFDNTEPDLAATFACAAQVGTSGSGDEEQVHGVLRATDVERNVAGACNDGFLRDDALLVVVVITDEEDEEDCLPILGCDGGTPADPEQWFNRLVTNKFSIETNVVMLNLVGLPGSSCADNASRIRDFGSRFTNYTEGEICSGNYADFFSEAISQIDTACQDFTPPG